MRHRLPLCSLLAAAAALQPAARKPTGGRLPTRALQPAARKPTGGLRPTRRHTSAAHLYSRKIGYKAKPQRCNRCGSRAATRLRHARLLLAQKANDPEAAATHKLMADDYKAKLDLLEARKSRGMGRRHEPGLRVTPYGGAGQLGL